MISTVSRIPVAYIFFILAPLLPNHLSRMRNRWRSWQLRRKQKTLSCRAATSLPRAISANFDAEGRKQSADEGGNTIGTVTNSIIYWMDISCACFVTGTCSRCVWFMLYLASERAWQHLAIIINIMPSLKSSTLVLLIVTPEGSVDCIISKDYAPSH